MPIVGDFSRFGSCCLMDTALVAERPKVRAVPWSFKARPLAPTITIAVRALLFWWNRCWHKFRYNGGMRRV